MINAPITTAQLPQSHQLMVVQCFGRHRPCKHCATVNWHCFLCCHDLEGFKGNLGMPIVPGIGFLFFTKWNAIISVQGNMHFPTVGPFMKKKLLPYINA